MPRRQDDPRARGESDVVVTVTTVRYSPAREIEVAREATATGVFDSAVTRALAQRLVPWALEQVLAKVLARRPAVGQAIAYEGWFTPYRQVLVSALPAGEPDVPVGRPRPIRGLFLPTAEVERADAGGSASAV